MIFSCDTYYNGSFFKVLSSINNHYTTFDRLIDEETIVQSCYGVFNSDYLMVLERIF